MRIQHCFPLAAVLICVAMTVCFAEELPAGRPYPEFQIGVTGIWAEIPDNPPRAPKDAPIVKRELLVTKTTEDTPAAGKFQQGDVLVSVNGKSLEIQDPRPVLGTAINKAEGSDGKMTFGIQRGGKKMDVTITLKVIGSYSKTWPADCKKSKHILDETIGFLLEKGVPKRTINGYCEALFLLSTGDDHHCLPLVERLAHEDIVHPVSTRGLSNWGNGYRGIFLAEYYLRTGDKKVLPKL